MVREDYLTFEQTKLLGKDFWSEDIDTYYALKDCYDGYDYPTFYKTGDVIYDSCGLSGNEIIGRPPLYLVQKWLRDEKGIHICPIWIKDYNCYNLEYNDELVCTYDKETSIGHPEIYQTYQEALSSGIDKALREI